MVGEAVPPSKYPRQSGPPLGDRIAAAVLVTSRIRIISAAIGSVSSVCTRANRSGSDADRHATAYGRTTVDATVMDATVMDASATSATPICEGVS